MQCARYKHRKHKNINTFHHGWKHKCIPHFDTCDEGTVGTITDLVVKLEVVPIGDARSILGGIE